MDSLSKRLVRMDRWIKRCAVACKCGSWSSALAEMECLEAESRELHDELWERASDEVHDAPRARTAFGRRMLASAALAFAFVLAVGLPLSMEPRVGSTAAEAPKNELIWVSRTESDVLAALRESLSKNNDGRIVLTLDRTVAESAAKGVRESRRAGAAVASESPAKQPLKPLSKPAAVAVKPTESPAKESREPSVEEVISLIQVGQRALRTGEPAVRIVQ